MKFTGERFIPDCGLESEIELEHLQRYLSIQHIVSGKRVLDVASGVGYGSALLAETSRQVYGMDIDHEAITYAKDHYSKQNLLFSQGSIAALPFLSNSIDVVVSFETIEHVGASFHNEFLKEIVRVLSPDGFLIISTPDKHIYSELANYRNEFHVEEFYRDEFDTFLRKFFSNVSFVEQLQELAFILTDNTTKSCSILRQATPALRGKYIIALCGQHEIPHTQEIVSVLFGHEGNYQKKIDRIIELQGEIEEKNQNIADNWDMIHERDAEIKEMKITLMEKDKSLSILSKNDIVKKSLIKENEQVVAGLHREIDILKANNDRLTQSLSHISSTKAWRIIQRLYRLKKIVFRT